MVHEYCLRDGAGGPVHRLSTRADKPPVCCPPGPCLWGAFETGVVTTQDLGRVMNAFGLEPSQDELHNMITEVDGSGAFTADAIALARC